MKYQKSIVKIRWSSHNLFIETGRYSTATHVKQGGVFYVNVAEEEYQYIWFCPVTANFRRKYIKEYNMYYKRPSMFKLF